MKKFNAKRFGKKVKKAMYCSVGPFMDGAIRHAGVMFPIYLITKPAQSLKGNIVFQIANAGLCVYEIWRTSDNADEIGRFYESVYNKAIEDSRSSEEIIGFDFDKETENLKKIIGKELDLTHLEYEK